MALDLSKYIALGGQLAADYQASVAATMAAGRALDKAREDYNVSARQMENLGEALKLLQIVVDSQPKPAPEPEKEPEPVVIDMIPLEPRA